MQCCHFCSIGGKCVCCFAKQAAGSPYRSPSVFEQKFLLVPWKASQMFARAKPTSAKVALLPCCTGPNSTSWPFSGNIDGNDSSFRIACMRLLCDWFNTGLLSAASPVLMHWPHDASLQHVTILCSTASLNLFHCRCSASRLSAFSPSACNCPLAFSAASSLATMCKACTGPKLS